MERAVDGAKKTKAERVAIRAEIHAACREIDALTRGYKRERYPPEPQRYQDLDGSDRRVVERGLQQARSDAARNKGQAAQEPLHDALMAAKKRLYSPQFEDGIEQLKQGDYSGAEYAISYIEADPFHFRSGYTKQRYARYLRRVELTEPDRERLRAAILASFRKGQRDDVAEYVRLGVTMDSKRFRKDVETMTRDPDEGVRWRAGRLLLGLERQAVVREKREFAKSARPGTWRPTFPPEFLERLEKLRSAEREGIEFAIRVIEANPFGVSAGRMKSELARALSTVELEMSDQERLVDALLAVVDVNYGVFPPAYFELAEALSAEDDREPRLLAGERQAVRLTGEELTRWIRNQGKERGGS